VELHDLRGEVKRWLKRKVDEVVLGGLKFDLPDFKYRKAYRLKLEGRVGRGILR